MKQIGTVVDPTKYKDSDWYRRIPNLKKSHVKTVFTDEMKAELKRCYDDIEYMNSRYVYITSLDDGLVKFKARDYQKDFWKLILNNNRVITKMARQMGKSTSVVGFLIHFCVFNKNKNIAIAAQNASQAMEIIMRFRTAYENLPVWMQSGVEEWNKKSIRLGNGTKIFASASGADSLRGQSINILILDEFAHIKNDEDFMTSTFPVVSSGKKTKIIILSTPNGQGNAFHDLYVGGENGTNYFKTLHVDYLAHPNRDEEWGKEQIAEIGERKFNQEYRVHFLGSSNTLISGTRLENMENNVIEPLHTDETYNVKIFKEPNENSQYVMVCDTGKGFGNDYSTFSIFDITSKPMEQICTFRDNSISTSVFPKLILKYAVLYNDAFIAVERNDSGHDVAQNVYYDLEYEEMYLDTGKNGERKPGFWVSNSMKRTACSALRDILESDSLIIRSKETLKEFKTFVGNNQGIYNATQKNHDDMVQNCWGLAFVMNSKYFQHFLDEENDISITKLTKQEEFKKMVESLPPIGNMSGRQNAMSKFESYMRHLTD